MEPNLLRFNLGAPNSQIFQYSDSLKAPEKPNSMQYNLGAPYSQESNIFLLWSLLGTEDVNSNFRDNKKDISIWSGSLFFLTENHQCRGAPGASIAAHWGPKFYLFSFFFLFLLFCVFFQRTADLSGPPINPSGPPFEPPLAWGPVKDWPVESSNVSNSDNSLYC